MTYGTFVARLIKENENAEEVNIQLEQIGVRIGKRIIDEFIAKSDTVACQSFEDTANVIAYKAFPMYFGAAAEIKDWA